MKRFFWKYFFQQKNMRPQLVQPNIIQEILEQKSKVQILEVKSNNSRWFTFFMIIFFLFVCLFIFMRYIEKKSRIESYQSKKISKNSKEHLRDNKRYKTNKKSNSKKFRS